MRRFLPLLFLFAFTAHAQTKIPSPTPANYFLSWDHDGANLDGFALLVDGARKDLGVIAKAPTGHYEAPFPALTPGAHTLDVVAYNVAGDSPKATLTVAVIVIPTGPFGVKIVQH